MTELTPSQCRAARAALGWHQRDLAVAAGVGEVTIRQFEVGKHVPKDSSRRRLLKAFEAAGLVVIGDDGEGREGLLWRRT